MYYFTDELAAEFWRELMFEALRRGGMAIEQSIVWADGATLAYRERAKMLRSKMDENNVVGFEEHTQ